MKRLTILKETAKNKRWYTNGKNPELGFSDIDREDYNLLWDKLAAYEDTDLEPSELAALKHKLAVLERALELGCRSINFVALTHGAKNEFIERVIEARIKRFKAQAERELEGK